MRGVLSEERIQEIESRGDVRRTHKEEKFVGLTQETSRVRIGEPDSSGMLVEDRLATLTQKSARLRADTRSRRKRCQPFLYDSPGTLERGTQWYFPRQEYKEVGTPSFFYESL